MVPGLPLGVPVDLVVEFDSTQNSPNIFSDLGSPSHAVVLVIYVRPGVIVGSNDAASAAVDLTPFNSQSKAFVINQGRIQAAGGLGGDGDYYFGDDIFGTGWRSWGAGGGGAGTVGGLGGYQGASRAASGTATSGGAGGEFTVQTPLNPGSPSLDGHAGGDAIACGSIELTINNSAGEIWGGGGGGGGTYQANDYTSDVNQAIWTQGGDGGDPGQPGSQGIRDGGVGAAGGAAGYAVRGSNVSFTDASGQADPNLKGPVGV